MDITKIERINALARKKRTVGLSQEELAEQKALYAEYIADYRKNVKSMLENVRVENVDGSYEPLRRVREDDEKPSLAPRDTDA